MRRGCTEKCRGFLLRAGVQSSLHDEDSDKALSIYMEGLSEANNMYLTSELKYRTDLAVWAEKQTILSNGGNILEGFSAGSAELFELAIPCLLENPKSQLADRTFGGCPVYAWYHFGHSQRKIEICDYARSHLYCDLQHFHTAKGADCLGVLVANLFTFLPIY